MSTKTQLHELLPVEGDKQGKANKIQEETYSVFSNKHDLFMGYEKKYEPYDENERVTAPEVKELTTTVDQKLEYAMRPMAEYYDVLLQKEATNQIAVADLVVDGNILAKDVPATFLLGMETRLKKLREVYNKIPTLEMSIGWEEVPDMGEGVYKTKRDEERKRQVKTFVHKVLYEATKEHPAQIEKWEEMMDVGIYRTVRWSGMKTPAEKSKMLGRLDKLISAVKSARAKANKAEVINRKIGMDMLKYVNTGEI